MALTATQLAPLFNSYTLSTTPQKTIVVPRASRLAALRDVTVSGKLLKKQLVTLNPQINTRAAKLATYAISADGDLHFCLGTTQLKPHIACELQSAKAFLNMFTQAIGETIQVSGFFRCLFEHPGFRSNDDAHIFEIHPVRAVAIGGQLHGFNVGIPEQPEIHTWTKPRPLHEQDSRITVRYDKARDELTFTGMSGTDENYIRESGTVSNVKLNSAGGAPASFRFISPNIGSPIQVYCLQGTTAAMQLRQLAKTNATMVALRNIDLGQALKNKYVINLLAIDIQ